MHMSTILNGKVSSVSYFLMSGLGSLRSKL